MSSTGDNADSKFHVETKDSPSGSEFEDEEKAQQSHDEDYESEREGRFHGPDSSWRFYTKEERAIAASLDQAENNDLSVHLYNAHAWKHRLRDANRMEESLPWHSKRRWIQREDNGKLPFLPLSAWTAWPLRPEDVPRSREQWGIPPVDPEDDKETFSKCGSWRPSLHLEEELKAAFLRRAKQGFREREQTSQPDEATFIKTNSEVPVNSKTISTRSESPDAEDSDDTDDEQKQNITREADDSDDNEGLESTAEYDKDNGEYRASMLLDDELASSILQPTVCHLTTKLDALLVGLHKCRLGHRQERSRSRGRSTGSAAPSKSRERARSSAGVPSKRKRAESDLVLDDADFELDPMSEDSESDMDSRAGRGAARGSRKRVLGTRDWSEVLGIAAMVGWDQDILDRAARRCAATFGESMTIRSMPETSFGESRDKVVEYMPQMIPDLDTGSEDEVQSDEDQVENEQNYGFACPEDDCPRHKEPYDKRWRLREHLKKKHKFAKEEVDRLVPHLARSSQENLFKGADEESDEDEDNDGEGAQGEGVKVAHEGPGAIRLDGFMQPINIRMHRSKDRSPRKQSASRPRTGETSAS